MEAEAEKCSLCGRERVPLPETTKKRGLTVFVCSVPVGKSKVPCDGDVYARATKES